MGKGFTFKLACNNIKQNRKFYLPYIFASIGIVMMFYIMCYLATNNGLTKLAGSAFISVLMTMGCVIIGIFAFIFMFYINSFLMKRRNKEIGLYNILGMEKKHIGLILLTENLITSGFSIIVGLLCGMLFSKLVHMILNRIMGDYSPITFTVSGVGIIASVIFFGATFLLILMRNQMRIHLANPIELLHGSNVGEREPKTKIVMSIIGVICLATGYYISITIENPMKAVMLFFVAVILVIIGTYLLFTTVSIAFLKALRKNKNFYYKPGHFTAVSGMLYRMKQNAVGMANICIISTMVLVMVSTTVCLSTGIDNMIDSMTPRDVAVRQSYLNEHDLNIMKAKALDDSLAELKTISEKHDVKVSNASNYAAVQIKVKVVNGGYKTIKSYGDETAGMMIITADQYKRLTGKNAGISGNQVITSDEKSPDTFKLLGNKYENIKHVDNLLVGTSALGLKNHVIVVSSLDKVENIVKESGKAYSGLFYYSVFDSKGSNKATMAAANEYSTTKAIGGGLVNTRKEVSDQLHGFSGGFLFLGIFLGIVFTFAAALIIYYKQISEGYYDKEKFEIMQKVGMSKDEVRKSIRSQVLVVFFIPLIVAGCHMAGAFNMVREMLSLFALKNIGLFVACSAVTFLAFAAIYAFVYAVTAKEYYKIVQWRE